LGTSLSSGERVVQQSGAHLAVSILLLVGCLEPARDRALRDELIGSATRDGTVVTVEDGLAVVRAIDGEHALLWQSAPAIRLDLERDQAGEFDFSVLNTMPRAELAWLSGVPVSVEEASREHPTRASFTLHFARAGRASFRLSAPNHDTVRPFRIALMSDVQEAIDHVGDLYRRMNAEPDVEFVLGAGDLTERGTQEELVRFERELETLRVPYYTTLGNHELGVTPPPYQDMFSRASFSFEAHGARFTLLDSASATVDPMVLSRLDRWLELGQETFHVVAMHIPLIDPVGTRGGSFASRNEANALLARLLKGSVDLTLYGHLHSYFRFENGGIPARVSGGGGAIPERFDRIGRHFLLIDIDPEAQEFESRLVQVDGD
jgi:3',5'-cyclic-AMP phosphodiesterase